MYYCDYKRLPADGPYILTEGAIVEGEVTLGEDVNVWHCAVIRGDEGSISVGRGTNIQDGAILHGGPMTVGAGCTIAHAAVVHACTVGNNVLVGIGATILNGARVGDNCIVAAGALVTGNMDAPAGSMLMGVPAKIVRQLTAEEIESNRVNAEDYVFLARQYRDARQKELAR